MSFSNSESQSDKDASLINSDEETDVPIDVALLPSNLKTPILRNDND